MNGPMWKRDERWPLILLSQWPAENTYVSKKTMLQTITMYVMFRVRLLRSALTGF